MFGLNSALSSHMQTNVTIHLKVKQKNHDFVHCMSTWMIFYPEIVRGL